jgi:hypothetical protein
MGGALAVAYKIDNPIAEILIGASAPLISKRWRISPALTAPNYICEGV